MEDSRQDLRTEFRAATETSGLAGFGLASVGMLGVPGPESSQARRTPRSAEFILAFHVGEEGDGHQG